MPEVISIEIKQKLKRELNQLILIYMILTIIMYIPNRDNNENLSLIQFLIVATIFVVSGIMSSLFLYKYNNWVIKLLIILINPIILISILVNVLTSPKLGIPYVFFWISYWYFRLQKIDK